jgi:hypothetical protein
MTTGLLGVTPIGLGGGGHCVALKRRDPDYTLTQHYIPEYWSPQLHRSLPLKLAGYVRMIGDGLLPAMTVHRAIRVLEI